MPRSVPQGHGNLGCRMQRQLQRAFAGGATQVVLIGTDLPSLERCDLEAAFAALEHTPLVLGPATDGGYWLIGLNRRGQTRAAARLMSGIPWGSERVLASTVAVAEGLQLPIHLLRRQSDLDARDDLTAWIRPAADRWSR